MQLFKHRILSLLCFLAGVSLCLSLQAKVRLGPSRVEPSSKVSPRRAVTIKVDVPLVLMSVTVTDPMNRLVVGLERKHFRLKEDKVPQVIKQFGAEDAPLSLGIVLDVSGSMGHKLSKAREAVAEFLRTANPEDEVFLVQFNDRPEIVKSFTRNLEQIQSQLIFTMSKGRTALLDGIYLAVTSMTQEAGHSKRALIVISDGADNSSRYTEREIKRLVREADVQIYAVGIFEPVHSIARTPEELHGPHLLTEIAEQTGGRHFPVENIGELTDIVGKIGIELRNQYVIGGSSHKCMHGLGAVGEGR